MSEIIHLTRKISEYNIFQLIIRGALNYFHARGGRSVRGDISISNGCCFSIHQILLITSNKSGPTHVLPKNFKTSHSEGEKLYIKKEKRKKKKMLYTHRDHQFSSRISIKLYSCQHYSLQLLLSINYIIHFNIIFSPLYFYSIFFLKINFLHFK